MEALCGVSTWEQHTGERKSEVLGRRGHSEAIFALAVPVWHCTVHPTVVFRIDGKLRSPKYARTPYNKKDGPYRPYRTVPSDRTSTSLIWMHRAGHHNSSKAFLVCIPCCPSDLFSERRLSPSSYSPPKLQKESACSSHPA